jgi:hypothetical protein
MDELIETVLMASDEFEPTILNFGWLTLIGCSDDVITATTHGDNNYELRHIGKDKALCNGTLPEVHIPSDDALELFDMMGGA